MANVIRTETTQRLFLWWWWWEGQQNGLGMVDPQGLRVQEQSKANEKKKQLKRKNEQEITCLIFLTCSTSTHTTKLKQDAHTHTKKTLHIKTKNAVKLHRGISRLFRCYRSMLKKKENQP